MGLDAGRIGSDRRALTRHDRSERRLSESTLPRLSLRSWEISARVNSFSSHGGSAVSCVGVVIELRAGAKSDPHTIRSMPKASMVRSTVRISAKWPPWIGVLATPSEAASAADAGRQLIP